MARTTIDYGIDLGTTNSSIAVFDGAEVKVIRNNAQFETTPSAVWIDKNGRLFVGATAYKRLEVDPGNAFAEFKIQMGTDVSKKFLQSGRSMRSEELSAEVLKSLKADVYRVQGEDLQAAVITVPAAFELPQNKATSKAAQLAGLSHTPLLQEPVAAAMAYGFQSKSDKVFWLVYDFGGGTFDAAVVSVRDGLIQVVNHEGDNHLGGKLIDWEIVNQLLVPALLKDRKLADFRRGNPNWIQAFAKLKYYAEEAKIQVSRDDFAPISIEHLCKDDRGEEVIFEYELRRQDVERLMEPFVLRSINTCRKALADKRLGPANIEKILLVGGPTLAPYLRQRLADVKEGLGIPLDFSIDPMTVVARGAAVYAATQRVAAAPAKAGEFALDLDYKPVGADCDPVVGGRVVAKDCADLSAFTIEFVNSVAQPAWRSGKIGLAPNGNFMATLWAEPARENIFTIELRDGNGSAQKTSPDRITYRIGMDTTDPPLTHTLGVALANNEMVIFVEKGTPLPAKKRYVLRTAAEVSRNSGAALIRVPVVEGENTSRADRNALIGTFEISGSKISRDVPAGSEIEVLIEIDQSRLVRIKTFIPWLDEEFEAEFDNQKKILPTNRLKEEAEAEKKRLDTVRKKAATVKDSKAEEALRRIDGERMVHDVDAALAAAGDDPDAADKCMKRILDLRQAIDNVEDAVEWPELIRKAEAEIKDTDDVVRKFGKSEDRALATTLEREAREAIKTHDSDVLKQKTGEITGLYLRIMRDQPGWWVGMLEHLEGRKGDMRSRGDAEALFNQGRKAINSNDVDGLRSAVRQLLALLPPAQQEEFSRGFGSTVGK